MAQNPNVLKRDKKVRKISILKGVSLKEGYQKRAKNIFIGQGKHPVDPKAKGCAAVMVLNKYNLPSDYDPLLAITVERKTKYYYHYWDFSP